MPKSSRWHQPRKWRLPTTGTWEERLAVVQTWDLHPFWRLLGVEVVGLGPSSSRLHVALEPEKHGAWPHGGLLSSLVDMSVAIALFAAYGPEDDDVIAHATADLNVTFVDAAEGSDIFAEGHIVRKARTAAFGSAEVRDERGRLIALRRLAHHSGLAPFLYRLVTAPDRLPLMVVHIPPEVLRERLMDGVRDERQVHRNVMLVAALADVT